MEKLRRVIYSRAARCASMRLADMSPASLKPRLWPNLGRGFFRASFGPRMVCTAASSAPTRGRA
jgi:hypothetical protein